MCSLSQEDLSGIEKIVESLLRIELQRQQDHLDRQLADLSARCSLAVQVAIREKPEQQRQVPSLSSTAAARPLLPSIARDVSERSLLAEADAIVEMESVESSAESSPPSPRSPREIPGEVLDGSWTDSEAGQKSSTSCWPASEGSATPIDRVDMGPHHEDLSGLEAFERQGSHGSRASRSSRASRASRASRVSTMVSKRKSIESQGVKKAGKTKLLHGIGGLADEKGDKTLSVVPDASEASADSEEVNENAGVLRSLLRRRVTGQPYFPQVVMAFIFLNALTMGLQADYIMNHPDEETPAFYTIVEFIFVAVFTVELALRLFDERCAFFRGDEKLWNLFDLFVVGLQLFEVAAMGIMGLIGMSQSKFDSNFSFFRVLRMVRLFKVMRLVRLIRFIQELRTMVLSVADSLRCLGGALMLLFFVKYVVSIYILQSLADAVKDDAALLVEEPQLLQFYGSLPRTMLTLYQAMTSGEDWNKTARLLEVSVSPLMIVLFALYIAFSVMLLMNVITGIFVDSALQTSRREQESETALMIDQLFSELDQDGDGAISWNEFRIRMSDPTCVKILTRLRIQEEDVQYLFTMLDSDGSGEIDREEFVNGFQYLAGEVSAMDIATLVYSSKRLFEWWKVKMDVIEHNFDTLKRLSGSTSASTTASIDIGALQGLSQAASQKAEKAGAFFNGVRRRGSVMVL